jgi:hypothetical protein
LATRQLRTGVNAGVGKFVQQHETVAADEHRDDPGIGEIARSENAGRFGALEFGQARFQLRIEGMIAGHQPRCARSGAILLDRGNGRLLDRGMLGEVEVVVARKRQQSAAIPVDPNSVFAQRLVQRSVEVSIPERCELVLRVGVERVHQ